MNRPAGQAGLVDHRDAVAGDDDLVGQRQIARIGVLATVAPEIAVYRNADAREERLGGGAAGAWAGGDQQRAATLVCQGIGLRAEFGRGAGGQAQGRRVAADQNRDPGSGEMRETVAPSISRAGQHLGREAGHRGVETNHVQSLGQAVLRGGQHQIETVERRPRAADMDHSRAALAPDPARHRGAAPADREHQIRPGWGDQGTGLVCQRRQRRAHAAIARRPADQPLAPGQGLALTGPAERIGQGLDLEIVAGPAPQKRPNKGRPERSILHLVSFAHRPAACIASQ